MSVCLSFHVPSLSEHLCGNKMSLERHGGHVEIGLTALSLVRRWSWQNTAPFILSSTTGGKKIGSSCLCYFLMAAFTLGWLSTIATWVYLHVSSNFIHVYSCFVGKSQWQSRHVEVNDPVSCAEVPCRCAKSPGLLRRGPAREAWAQRCATEAQRWRDGNCWRVRLTMIFYAPQGPSTWQCCNFTNGQIWRCKNDDRERERDTSGFRGTPFSDTDAGRFVPKLNWNSCIECCAFHSCLWLLDGPSAGPLWETRCSWNGVEHGRAVNVGTGPSTWVVAKQKHATKGIGQLHLMFHHWVLSLEQHIHSTTWRLRPKKFSKPMLLGLNWHGKW